MRSYLNRHGLRRAIPISFPLLTEIDPAIACPWYYGFVCRRFERQTIVIAPIGLNWIFALSVWLYHHIRYPRFARPGIDEYAHGYEDGLKASAERHPAS